MESNEILSENSRKEHRIWIQKNRIEEKLKKGNLSPKKEKILKQERDRLKGELEKIQNAMYL